MESGYVNEGGQLKTKNGQKYVFNGPPSGIYITKTCAICSFLVAVLAILTSIILTYFLTVNTVPSCATGYPEKSVPNGHDRRVNETQMATAYLFGMPSSKKQPDDMSLNPAPVGDIPDQHDLFGDPKTAFSDRKLQLYEGWTPLHYQITIEPNIDVSQSNGSLSVEIERDPREPSLEPIVLDVNNVTISNVRVIRTVKDVNGEEIEVDFEGEYGSNNETFIIMISKVLSEEKSLRLIVSLDFVSQITDTLQGVYKTSYINTQTNEKEWMVSTHFSPIDARRAFPCFDRPDMKANFTISIIRPTKTFKALSNMPIKRSLPHRYGFTKDDFMTTPKMPTYLVAFVVSNLVKSNYSDMNTSTIPKVEIWTRSENQDMTRYAYTRVRKFLPFFEEYFDFKNRLQKIDLVSIPDFAVGAMENWGLITFRDSSLLVPDDLEKASSTEHMEFVAQVIAHELAHEWFGNLVTPKSWRDLWLKEGFACYMSYLALNELHPEFESLETFTISEFKESMAYDADNTSHAISFDVKSTNDIRRIFDPITYSKGTILLRMLSSIVGPEAFREATQDFLKTFAYGNADLDDLWEFMTRHAHAKKTLPEEMHIKDVMDSWTNKPGFPVVTVQRHETDIILTQERYFLPSKNLADESKWVIPITFETDELRKGHNIPSHWLTPNDQQVIVKDVFKSSNNSANVVYLNLNRQGYYRVNYDEESWLALQKEFAKLPRITRAQLLDDALQLARGEYIPYDIPLTFLMEIFTLTDDELLWSAAQNGIAYLTHMLQREPAYETFRAFMKSTVRPAFDRYGLNEPENESHLQLQHRARVARLACKFNYDRCTIAAHVKFRDWMSNPKEHPIKPNLKSTIYCTAITEGSFQEWYFAYKQYKRTTSASEKEQILNSLGCTTKPWLLSKYLSMTINSTSGIQKQDGVRAFRAVANNPIGFEIAFDFLQSHIKEISEYFGDGFSALTSMIKSITTYMNKESHKDQLVQFAAKANKLGLTSVESAIELAMEQVNNNIYWRKNSYYNLKGFLEAIVSDFHINIF